MGGEGVRTAHTSEGSRGGLNFAYLCGEGHAPRDEEAAAFDTGGHHGKFAFIHEGDEVFDLLSERGFILVLLLVWILGLAACVCVAE